MLFLSLYDCLFFFNVYLILCPYNLHELSISDNYPSDNFFETNKHYNATLKC